MYHRVDVTAPERLHLPSADRLARAVRGGAAVPARQGPAHDRHRRAASATCATHRSLAHDVLLTFDDGYGDQFRYAFPILQRYGDVATFFVNVGTIGTPRHLTLGRGRSDGARRHVDRLPRRDARRSVDARRVGAELSDRSLRPDAQRALCTRSVLAYAYPSGAFDAETIELEQRPACSSASPPIRDFRPTRNRRTS